MMTARGPFCPKGGPNIPSYRWPLRPPGPFGPAHLGRGPLWAGGPYEPLHRQCVQKRVAVSAQTNDEKLEHDDGKTKLSYFRSWRHNSPARKHFPLRSTWQRRLQYQLKTFAQGVMRVVLPELTQWNGAKFSCNLLRIYRVVQ